MREGRIARRGGEGRGERGEGRGERGEGRGERGEGRWEMGISEMSACIKEREEGEEGMGREGVRRRGAGG